MIKLFRPVGLKEMELILDMDCKGFPQRLPEQPYFYPVLNIDYARQIALDWNTVDDKSGFVGYVTEFHIDDKYASNFEQHMVGSSIHKELWVPAENLVEFNQNITGNILILEAYYGINYTGLIPIPTILKNKSIKEQILALKSLINYNGMDFRCEVSAQWKMIVLNLPLWLRMDMSDVGLVNQDKVQLLKRIYSVLADNKRDYIAHFDSLLN